MRLRSSATGLDLRRDSPIIQTTDLGRRETSSYHKIALIFQQYLLTIQFHNSFTSKLEYPPMSASWKNRASAECEFDVVKLFS